MFKYMDMTVREILERFPKGFAMDPEGNIYEVLGIARHRSKLPENPPEKSGFIFAQVPKVRNGDSKFGMELEEPITDLDDLQRLTKEQNPESDQEARALYEHYLEILNAAT